MELLQPQHKWVTGMLATIEAFFHGFWGLDFRSSCMHRKISFTWAISLVLAQHFSVPFTFSQFLDHFIQLLYYRWHGLLSLSLPACCVKHIQPIWRPCLQHRCDHVTQAVHFDPFLEKFFESHKSETTSNALLSAENKTECIILYSIQHIKMKKMKV